MDANGTTNSESSRQIQVRFVTKLQPPLKAPTSSISVPSNLTRMGLSEIVNLLLKNVNSEYKHQPFDFLIDGEFVRMSLEQFLLAKGISAEKVLEIEYVKAVAPRKQEDPCLHDDWVSAIDGSDPRFILTGCYDNFSRIWKAGAFCSHILEGHSSAITSVCILKNQGVENRDIHIATCSKDRTLRLWMFDTTENVDHPMKIRAYKVLKGHTASVQSISSTPLGDMVCSGSWDCSIKLWQVKDSEEGDFDSVSIKKRKLVSDLSEESQSEGLATTTFLGHTQCVSSVVWPEVQTIYSASWDHSIRTWDVETGKSPFNLQTKHPLNCLDVGGESSALIAAGGYDSILRIWDPRKPGSLAPSFQFSSHSSWITSCKWHSRSSFHMVSSSFDGKVMLWDLRTAWPLAVIDSHEAKVLCADWWKDDSVISGGADSKLRISSEVTIW